MLKSAFRLKASHPVCAAIAAAGLATAAPAHAQPTVGEVVVTARGGVAPFPSSLSEPVGYADLDLSTDQGRAVLHERIRAAADDLCRRLGEQNTSGSALLPSCEQDAVNAARAQEQLAYAQPPGPAAPAYAYAPAAPAYVAPPAPYPADEPAASASAYGAPAAATVTTETVTNGPVPDTPQNRARFGGPMSNGGRRTMPAGN